jgi:AcrR family transcriptional regulator
MTAGLRERNKLRRHEQITDAALRLFAEQGFDGTTIDEIAAAADVSRRTFFRYFARKEDVILGWKQRTAEELREALASRPASESPLDAVHGALATIAASYAARPDLTLGLMRLFESPPTFHPDADHEAWDAVLTEGLARRLGADPILDPEPRLLATVGFAVLIATIQSWGAAGGEADLVGLLDDGFAALRGAAKAHA